MQNTKKPIHTKFGFNWSSSIRGEEFWKVVNDDKGNLVMAKHSIYLLLKEKILFIYFKHFKSSSLMVSIENNHILT